MISTAIPRSDLARQSLTGSDVRSKACAYLLCSRIERKLGAETQAMDADLQ
jgi:hypothetical protein